MAKSRQKEPELNINDERQVRLAKLKDLKRVGIDPYPAKAERAQSLIEALKQKTGVKVAVAGRIMSKREMGRLTFCHLQDETARLQLVFRQDMLGEEPYDLLEKKIDTGDIIAAQGERFVTKKGEESILVKRWVLLAKAIRPLPDKFHGLHDEELRLRKRYLDLLINPELKDRFRRKAKFWQNMRVFLLKAGFLEVETPILETMAGGADAEPFISHHKALDLDVYLRISMGELWQKRLMVAGFEKTFEIGRQFRNEGFSREHLQDYTQMEFYWAYADYRDGMELVRRLYQYIAKETFGTLQFDIAEFSNIDLSGDWEELPYVETIEKIAGINVLNASAKNLTAKLNDLAIRPDAIVNRARLMDALWKYCRKEIKGPSFLVDLPVAVSPLAKRKANNPHLTERYQVIIAGSELGNGYSELNDPIDQTERFKEQQRWREAGDREAQMFDQSFVEAMEHGLPPTTGFGVSERLFSFLENQPIRECVLFPLMKPENSSP